MVAGQVVAALSFLVAAAVDLQLARGAKVNILWQLPQIVLITVAEILVSVTGLEYSYTQAPESLRASVSALFLLTTAVGDVFGGVLYASCGGAVSRPTILCICAFLMLVTSAAFLRVARRHFREPEPERTSFDSDSIDLPSVENVLLGEPDRTEATARV